MSKYITTYESTASWINITRQKKPEAIFLKENFSFFPQDIREILPPLQRTKIRERPGYLFLVLVFPIYDRKTKIITPTELDIFLTRKQIITIHSNKIDELKKMELMFKQDPIALDKFLSSSPMIFLYELLYRIYGSISPMLTHMSNDINRMENLLFSQKHKDFTLEILRIKQNIFASRKFLNIHKRTLKQLRDLMIVLDENNSPLQIRINEIIEHTREIWDELENYAYTITALHESYESLKSHYLNTIMKTLTIFSVIVFPLTLLAALFGMNTTHMPLVENQYGFWIIIGFMCVGMLFMLILFRYKKWL